MSAFMVDDSCISNVLSAIERDRGSWRAGRWYEPLLQFAPGGEIPKLGIVMLALNADGVRERYGDRDDMGTDATFQYTPHPTVSPEQALKSLQCWLYQCTEGHVPDTPLYKAAREAAGRFAVTIVEQTKAYDVAVWG